MKKIIILLPVYNDWESLIKVLEEINSVIKDIQKYKFECIIVNDSSTIEKPKIIKPKSFNSLKIIDMKENRGHARCNASRSGRPPAGPWRPRRSLPCRARRR